MAKLYFRYAAMGGGKSLHLLNVVSNYERVGQKCIVAKPGIDTKAGDKVSTRLGLERKVDYIITENDNLKGLENYLMMPGVNCVVVDEAQFLSPEQVWALYEITKELDVPIIAYGLRTRVNAKPFTGSGPLLAVADDIEEIKSICKCGKKASFQVRYINGELDMGDVEVIIDSPENNVEYVAKCGDCYCKLLEEYKKKQEKVRILK